MLRGLWNLTWLETKIFVREPLGLVGSVVVPVVLFVALGRSLGGTEDAPASREFIGVTVPVFAALFIVLNAVVSLVAIMSIYREGGILKRLRATPLRPHTILTAHVLVKLGVTGLTLLLMILAGRRFYPVAVDAPFASFSLALAYSAFSILSIGFLIASIVPTARFAQSIASLIMYPMIAVSGLFIPLEEMPGALRAIWRGCTADLRCVAPRGDLEPRGVVCARRRHRGAVRDLSDLHQPVSESIPVGVVAISERLCR